MVEEVMSDLYRLEIPLPRSPLKAINSYLIKGDGRFLLIDTGMNRGECLSVITSDLNRLGVDLERTDFFITHLHADHLGLAGTLATDNSKVYFNEVESRITSRRVVDCAPVAMRQAIQARIYALDDYLSVEFSRINFKMYIHSYWSQIYIRCNALSGF